MNTSSNVYLIGPMGVGKTTIGKALAKNLSLEFVDSDREIENRTGVSIMTIFDIEGDAGFRNREVKVILEIAKRRGIIGLNFNGFTTMGNRLIRTSQFLERCT